jgi:hypothetical protein
MKNLKLFNDFSLNESENEIKSGLIQKINLSKSGENYDKIKEYQAKLNLALPEDAPKIEVDGFYGGNTEKAIRKVAETSKELKGTDGKALTPKIMKYLDKKSGGKKINNNTAEKSKDYLLFNGNKLQFIENGKAVKSWTAVSGRTYYHWYIKPAIWNKRYTVSHTEWSKAKNEGPTPPGLYTLGATQHREIDTKWKTDPNYAKKVVARSTVSVLPGSTVKDTEGHEFNQNTASSKVAWGDYRWALNPKPGTNTFGRSSFYLHGGSAPGSIGCIDLITNSDDFAKYYAKWKEKTGNKTIEVKIDYSTFKKDGAIDVESQPYTMPINVKTNTNNWYNVTDKDITDTLGKDKIVIKPELLKKRRS